MTEAFKQGYMDKMAELRKQSEQSLDHDLAGAIVPGITPLAAIYGPANAIGHMIGQGSGRDLSEAELAERLETKKPWESWIPGVAGYRLGLRTGGVTNSGVRDKAKELGVKRVRPNWNAAMENISIGDLLTGGLGRVGGLVGSAITDHRSLEEQVEHDKDVHFWKNLLIPGYGAYNQGKRLGVSRDLMDTKKNKSDDDEDDENKKNKKNKTDKED